MSQLQQRINPCLWFDNQAEAAANYYTGIFKHSKIKRVTHYTEAGKEVHGRKPGSKAQVCGWLKDKFGLSWQVTPDRLIELLSDDDRERAARVMTAMLKMKKIDLNELERAAKSDVSSMA